MFPGCTNAGGSCMGMPDACLTPAGPAGQVPIPYPNNGMLMQADQVSTKVQFVNKDALTVDSKIPQSMGDEAGVGGGVTSGTNMDAIAFKLGSSKVKVEGSPVARLTSITAHNGTSANMPAGAVIAPSQIKVLVAF